MVVDLDDVAANEAWFTGQLLKLASRTRVVGIVSALDPHISRLCQSLGLLGVTLKTSPSAALLELVRTAAKGGSMPLPPMAASSPAREPDEEGWVGEQLLLDQLTPREREILQAVGEGFSTREVAERMSISGLTVQSHVKSILAKLGVHSKIAAVGFALRHGLVSVKQPGEADSDEAAPDESLEMGENPGA